jgi:hypothetical protein
MPVILATWEAEIRRIAVQGQPGHIVGETPISKIIRAKRAGGKAQGVELLSSNPSPSKRNLIFFSSCTTPVTTIPLITILALCCTLQCTQNKHKFNSWETQVTSLCKIFMELASSRMHHGFVE